jgi:hypothetical protein
MPGERTSFFNRLPHAPGISFLSKSVFSKRARSRGLPEGSGVCCLSGLLRSAKTKACVRFVPLNRRLVFFRRPHPRLLANSIGRA